MKPQLEHYADRATYLDALSAWELERSRIHDQERYQQIRYAEYIMEHCGGDRMICNGDSLIAAMEDGYLWDAFLESERGEI